MITLDEALGFVLDRMPPRPVLDVDVADAVGLVVARDVRSGEAVPGWDNSAVDGYAVRSAEVTRTGVELDVVATVAAGMTGDVTVGAGEAVRIMTGAPVPEGADAVVMVERTVRLDDGARVRIDAVVGEGEAVRRAGEDVEVGDVVVAAGEVLGPGHVGLLASIGVSAVPVRRRTVVGVMSSGDELVEGAASLERGQVRDSNRPALVASCRGSGFEVVDLGLVPDDPARIEAAIRAGVSRCDALLTSGGVSMGDFDHVKEVLARIADVRWMQIAIRPAKPFAFGLLDGTPVFGLPGNPVSSLVSFELLARPALLAAGGRSRIHRRRIRAVADEDFPRRPDGKIHFVRVRVDQDDSLGFRVRSAGGQGSHQMTGLACADGLAVLHDGDGTVAGGTVEVLLLDG